MNISTAVAASMVAVSLPILAAAGVDAQTAARSASVTQPNLAAAEAASSWTCPFANVELAPVSHDTAGRRSEWVMVYRVKGEIVAAERVSPSEVDQIRATPCKAQGRQAHPSLVG